MGLENVVVPVLPDQLNSNWPLPEDPKSQGDDHLRNMKAALINFYSKVNFSGLGSGAIPVYLDGKFWNSGFDFSSGQATLLRPFVSPMHIQAGGLNLKKYQLVGVELTDSAVKRPESPTAGAVTELTVQPVDSSVNSAPISWSFTQDSDAWIKGVIVRGAAAISGVRITLRDTNSLGAILYQTASDAELIAGGGASIAASGESTLAFPQKLEMFAGNNLFVVVDRYDSVAGVFTGEGISLKGTVVSGQFIPYQRSVRQAITRKPLAVKSDIPVLSYLADSVGKVLTTTLSTIANFSYTSPESASVVLDTSVMLQNIPNGNVTVNILVNGVLLDTGGGFTARLYNTTAGAAQALPITMPAVMQVGLNSIEVRAQTSTGTPQKLVCRLMVSRTDQGDVWA